MAKLFIESGTIVLAAFVSPIRRDSDKVRSIFQLGDFIENYCHCSVEVCAERDPKDHYRCTRARELKDFTGVSEPYEEPMDAELWLETTQPLETCVGQMTKLLVGRALLPA